MTLVNSLLALGALAFTIPLAIHLLYRSRFVTVEWGAMHLLEGVVRVNRRRLQWSHWLLLLLRCLIPVLLALCLARPMLTGFRALAGDAPQSLVLVIDDSRSMAARDDSGQTRIERAKQQLIATLNELSRHDEVWLVPASGADELAGAMGPQAAVAALRGIRAQSGPVDLGSLLTASLEIAEAASHPHRQIILVSDFQSHMVDDSLLDSLDRLAAKSQQSRPRPVIRFWDLGGDSERLQNVSVESVRVESPAVIAGRPADYTARIRNASDTPAAGVRVQWSVDGNRMDPQRVTLPARSTRTIRLRRTITGSGVHEIAVAVELADALPEDNRRRLAVDVIREVGVLLVDGAPGRRPLESETDFLAMALSPFAFGQQQQRSDAARARVVAPARAAEELASKRWDVVVLANVASLEPAVERSLVRFVHRGGGLVVFDGDSLSRSDYNRPWTSGALSITLPARLGSRVGDPAVRDESAVQVGQLAESFDAWSVLGDNDQRPFAAVDVFAYRKLLLNNPSLDSPSLSEDPVERSGSEQRSADVGRSSAAEDGGPTTDSPPSAVLLRTAGGDPLVVSARRGLGQIVQFAIPCDTAWSTLPLRPVFLPMMQQLVLELAGTRTTATAMTGEPLVVPLTEFEIGPAAEGVEAGVPEPADAPSRPPEYRYSMQPPAGGQRRVEPTADPPARLIYAETTLPGTYRIRRTPPDAGEQDDAAVASTVRVVEVSAKESELRDVEPARLTAVADSLQATVYPDAASLRADDRMRRFGREIWRWLWTALLVAMVAEVAVAQYAVRRSRAGAVA